MTVVDGPPLSRRARWGLTGVLAGALALSALLSLAIAAGARAVRGALVEAAAAEQERAAAPDPDLVRTQRAIDRRLRTDEQITRWRQARGQLMRAGDELLERGDHRAAIDQYQEVLGLFPSDEKALQRLARCWLALGEPARALPLADRAAKVDPRELGAFRLRARAAAALGQLERALDDLGHVLRVTPGDRETRLMQAELFERAGLPHHAIRAWSRVLMTTAGGDDAIRRQAEAALDRLVRRIATADEEDR